MNDTQREAEQLSILIIDDDRDFAEGLGDILIPRGYQVDLSYSADTALKHTKEHNIDVALIDIRLGRFNGIDLIPSLKQNSPRIICIMVTAYADTESAINAVQKGADDYLRKPLHGDDLLAAIKRCIRKRQRDLERNASENALRVRTQTEEKLRSQKELLNNILSHIPHFIYWKDLNSNYLGCNDSYARMAGFTSIQEIIGKNDFQLGWNNDKANFYRESDKLVLSTGKSLLNIERPETLQDGNQVTFLSSKVPLRNIAGQVIGVLGIDYDITERKDLENQLRQAQKMEAIGQLAGGVAHDFNNLLQAILGYSQMAIEEISSNTLVVELLLEVTKSAERAAALTQQLLAFSRRQVLQPVDLNMDKVVTDLARMLHRVLGEHVELSILSDPRLWTVHADQGQMEQTIINLCVNSRDAMPSGGKIEISTLNTVIDKDFCEKNNWAKPGNYVLLSVADNGEGMSAQVREHIFEPFFTTKELGKGTGLGLATVYGIAKQHDGLISVDSKVGVGSTFYVYLPIAEHRSINDPDQEEGLIYGGDETILFAEDEEIVRQLTIQILERAGYKVFAACDGKDAVQVFMEHMDSIDIILLDAVMPKMSGTEAYKEINRIRPDMPVLFSSGYNIVEEMKEEQLHLIQKPFNPHKLLRKIRSILDSL
jgi:PAS domain S-box-containing protein